MKLSLILVGSLISATSFIYASSIANEDSELINSVAVAATPEAENLNVEAETGKKRKADAIESVQEPEEEDWVFNEFFEVFYKYSRVRRAQLHKTLMFIRNDDVQGFQDDEENFKKVFGKDYEDFRFKETEPSIFAAMIAFNSQNFLSEYLEGCADTLNNDMRAVKLLSRHASLVPFLRTICTCTPITCYWTGQYRSEEVPQFKKEILEANPDAPLGQKILIRSMLRSKIDVNFVDQLLNTESDFEAYKLIAKWPSPTDNRFKEIISSIILEYPDYYRLADSNTKIQFIDLVSEFDTKAAQKLIDMDSSILDAVYTLNVDRSNNPVQYTNLLTMSIATSSAGLFDLVVKSRPQSVTLEHIKDILNNIYEPLPFYRSLYSVKINFSNEYKITLEDGSEKTMNVYQICFQLGMIKALNFLADPRTLGYQCRDPKLAMAEKVMGNLRKLWPSYADLWNHCKTFPEDQSKELIQFLRSKCCIKF